MAGEVWRIYSLTLLHSGASDADILPRVGGWRRWIFW